MKRKLAGKLEVRRETLGSLDGRYLKEVAGAATDLCSTPTRKPCTGCDVCDQTDHTCPV